MGLASVSKLDRLFGRPFLGFVLAVGFGLLSIYTEFWKVTAPNLEFELVSNSPVLDVREKLPELEVLYRSEDIANSGKTLSVLLVRAINRGTADILNSFYDSKDPVGLDIVGGTLIRADLSDASNEYLSRSVGISAVGPSVSFSPVIIEGDEWFVVKALVLHDVGRQPTVSAHGKVAGQKKIRVVAPTPTGSKDGFWYRAFSGDIWVQLVRVPAYVLAFGFCVFAVVAPISAASDWMQKRRRRKVVRRFKSVAKMTIENTDEFIFDTFVNEGAGPLQRMLNAVADPESLDNRVASYRDTRNQVPIRGAMTGLPASARTEVMFYGGEFPLSFGRFRDVGAMIDNKLIVEQDGKWVVNGHPFKVLTSFMEFLEMVGTDKIYSD